MHLFGKESFEQGFVNGNGDWYPKSEIVYVDSKNQPVPQAEASFNQLIELDNSMTIDDYLLHTITAVYHLTGEGVDNLLEIVKSHSEIYWFNFNYTRSYSPDPAFLIENENQLFLLVGKKATFDFITNEDHDDLPTEDEAEDDDESLDFSMM